MLSSRKCGLDKEGIVLMHIHFSTLRETQVSLEFSVKVSVKTGCR